MKELKGLTGLRFLAALYVTLYHAERQVGLPLGPGLLRNIISQGALGVTVFFVLSGFILTYAHLPDFAGGQWPGGGYYRQFLGRRLARIFPVHLAGLVACLAVSAWFGAYPDHFPVILALDAALLESYVPALAMHWYGGGDWSISTEFFFYLLFPLLLPLAARVRTKGRLLLLLAGLVGASVLPGFYYTFHQASPFELAYNFPPSRLPEFGCGLVLGLLVLRHGLRVPEWVAVAGLLLAACYLGTFAPRLMGYTIHHVVVVPATLALIAVLVRAERTRLLRWVAAGPMRYLGRLSFSFYLVQTPLMLVLDELLARKAVHKGDYYLLLPLLALNLALAALLHAAVEQPARRAWLRRLAPARPVAG